MPYLSRAADRPRIEGGIASGDVAADSAVDMGESRSGRRGWWWSAATDDSFKAILGAASAEALPDADFTSKLLLGGLPAGQDIFYRVRFENIAEAGISGEAQVGHFRTAPVERRSVSFAWSGDTAGQGWGIDPARGGMRTYRTMLENRPDFFIHCGDHIYADCPIEAELKLPDGNPGGISSRKKNPPSRIAWRSFAATTNITCSTRIYAPSMRRCRCSRSGTIMK